MGLSRASLERQLEQANTNLSAWNKTLDERGVAAKQRRNDAKWRQLNAKARQLQTRLKRVKAVEDLDAELKARRENAEPATAE